MKVIAYSDAHRGITANYEKLHRLGDIIEYERPDLVLGVGDNYTLDWIPWADIISWPPSGRSIAQQKRIASYITWV